MVDKSRVTDDDILNKVKGILANRQEEYGIPEVSLGNIANDWSGIVGEKLSIQQVCLMMMYLKLARLRHNINYEDSWIDVIGYAIHGMRQAEYDRIQF